MKLLSSSFSNGGKIPRKYTADGPDKSPELTWAEVPAGTQSLALLCEDPDAPSPRQPAAEPWVHWIIFNISPEARGLPEAVERNSKPNGVLGAWQGVNSWQRDNAGYRGPAPPPGSGKHRYFFRLYALDEMLPLEAGIEKQQLLQAMAGHVIAECELMGTYQRPIP